MSSAGKCRQNGWTPGTVLVDGRGCRIVITAVGEKNILARMIRPKPGPEASWTLEYSDWRKHK